MKKKIFLFFTLLFSYFFPQAQISKNTWLVGGSGSFRSYKESRYNSGNEYTVGFTDIQLSTTIGYFPIEKFALGLSPSFSYHFGKSPSGSKEFSPTRFMIGPFLRYYFLNIEKGYNVLIDTRYQLGIAKSPYGPNDQGNTSNFSIMGGAEIFFNSSVGMEILLGYNRKKEKLGGWLDTENIQKGFQTSIGFQFHLEKF